VIAVAAVVYVVGIGFFVLSFFARGKAQSVWTTVAPVQTAQVKPAEEAKPEASETSDPEKQRHEPPKPKIPKSEEPE